MRLRELGFRPGRYEPGPANAITDVSGVAVGHRTLRRAGPRPVLTGVTAILPPADPYAERLLAGSYVLNGAGELTGLSQLREWGLLETPIVLTNTFGVGPACEALVRHALARAPTLGLTSDVVLPVVGECDDSWLHDARGLHVRPEHVLEALADARPGPVVEGNVGAGTGMSTFDFAGGIGTSSRVVPYAHAVYTLGVLVLSNFGSLRDLRVEGVRLGERLSSTLERPLRKAYGSIVAVLATDAPLLPTQLDRLCKRAALGIARAGSSAAHGSGEIVVGFSTAQRVPRTRRAPLWELTCLYDTELNPLFEAACEVTEEAILNALTAGSDSHGIDGHFCPALPLEALRAAVRSPGDHA